MLQKHPFYRKGNWLIFQYHQTGSLDGNISEPQNARGSPRKSYLFLLTDIKPQDDHGIELIGDMVIGPGRVKHFFVLSGELSMAHEN